MSKHTGRVGNVVGPLKKNEKVTVSVVVDDAAGLKPGDTVTVEKVLTDEDIGRRLREMLTKHIPAWQIRELAVAVDEDAGWPMLADLIREVVAK